jgi:hypothetical protein
MRFAYDSIYNALQNERSILTTPEMNVEEFSFSIAHARKSLVSDSTNNNNNNSANRRNHVSSNNDISWRRFRQYIVRKFREFPDQIYIWDSKFRFTTIIICTYTLAYIILFHLTFIFIFLYTSKRTSYISYLKHIFQAILKIGMINFDKSNDMCLF